MLIIPATCPVLPTFIHLKIYCGYDTIHVNAMTKKLTKSQRIIYRRMGIGLLVAVALFLAGWKLSNANIAVLNPRGIIATKEYHLLVFGTILSLLIIVPVFIMTFVIVRKYRVTNNPTKYSPDWDHDRKLETIWWGVPLLIIMVIAVVTVQSSHDLDPFNPISSTISDKQPLKVQVVALQWKWLFIYPDQGVASVNYLQFPADTPIDFEITADSPMNSFWIPQLGGQIYAMSGMSTQLHLMADKPGEFRGVSANLSGDGFAGMDFKVRSVPNNEFADWVQNIKHSAPSLSSDSYDKLARPSKNNPPTFYNFGGNGTSIYDTVVEKYMAPAGPSNISDSSPASEGTDQNNGANSMDTMNSMMPQSNTRMQQHGTTH